MSTTALKSLPRFAKVNTGSAPLCVGIAKGRENKTRKKNRDIGEGLPNTSMVDGFPEVRPLGEAAIPKRIAAQGVCYENCADIARELGFDMKQVVVTPAMLIAAVCSLRNVVINGLEWLCSQLIEREQGALPSRLYTREELAEYLGVGLTTLDTMRQDPTFPSIHLTDARNRGSVRFDLNEVLQHLRTKNAILREMAR